MKDFYDEIETEINSLVCVIHDEYPVFALDEDRVKLVTCCIEFKIICYKILIRKLSEYRKVDKFIPYSKSEMKIAYKADDETLV